MRTTRLQLRRASTMITMVVEHAPQFLSGVGPPFSQVSEIIRPRGTRMRNGFTRDSWNTTGTGAPDDV